MTFTDKELDAIGSALLVARMYWNNLRHYGHLTAEEEETWEIWAELAQRWPQPTKV